MTAGVMRNPLDGDEARQMLVRNVPGFASVWDEYAAGWGDEQPGLTLMMGKLGRHFVSAVSKGAAETITAALDAAEQLIHDGDSDVSDAVYLGFVESVLFAAERGELSVDRVRALLPRGLRAAFDVRQSSPY